MQTLIREKLKDCITLFGFEKEFGCLVKLISTSRDLFGKNCLILIVEKKKIVLVVLITFDYIIEELFEEKVKLENLTERKFCCYGPL